MTPTAEQIRELKAAGYEVWTRRPRGDRFATQMFRQDEKPGFDSVAEAWADAWANYQARKGVAA